MIIRKDEVFLFLAPFLHKKPCGIVLRIKRVTPPDKAIINQAHIGEGVKKFSGKIPFVQSFFMPPVRNAYRGWVIIFSQTDITRRGIVNFLICQREHVRIQMDKDAASKDKVVS